MSIKGKLTLMTMGISAAAVILTVTTITCYLIYDMHRSKTESLALTAAIAGDRNSAALLFQYKEQAQNNLEIYRLSPSILAACIYNAKGALFAGYEAGNTCPRLYGSIPQKQAGILSTSNFIRKNGDVIGYIYMASDTREITAYINKTAQISFIAIAIVLGVALLLTLYFRRTISDPLLELASHAQRITKSGDYGLEARDHYPDETGVLARAFNEMLCQVRKRDNALMHANEGLEEKVEMRTRELNDARKKAELASEAKSEFLRNMSHEFRTPLHAILSFSSYGGKECKTATRDTLKNYFLQIAKGSERLGKLVNEVLNLAQLEHGSQAFSREAINLSHLAREAAEQVAPLMKDKNIRLSLDCPREAIGSYCDRDKIMQVITNLLSNAIKFTPSGKSITLTTRLDGGQAECRLTDEGIGIPEEEKEAIFESFRQSSRTNTGAGGTGLGLAICRNIIKAHGGRIWAENNTPAPGATIIFTLPAAAQLPHIPAIRSQEVPHEIFYQA